MKISYLVTVKKIDRELHVLQPRGTHITVKHVPKLLSLESSLMCTKKRALGRSVLMIELD